MRPARMSFHLALCAAAGLVLLQAPPSAPAQQAGGVARGQLIASGGGPGGRTAACFSCHGIDGSGQAGSAFPRLAGLDWRYLARQLDAYASGARRSDIMSPIARALSPEDRRAVAAYYERLSFRAGVDAAAPADPELVQHGAVLYARGSSERRFQACINCHGPNARGLPPTFPALAGQPARYLADQIDRFRSGKRTADDEAGAAMVEIARRMSDRDIEACAAYLSRLVWRPARAKDGIK